MVTSISSMMNDLSKIVSMMSFNLTKLSSMMNHFSNVMKLFAFSCVLGLVALNVWWFHISTEIEINVIESNDVSALILSHESQSSTLSITNSSTANGNLSGNNGAVSDIDDQTEEAVIPTVIPLAGIHHQGEAEVIPTVIPLAGIHHHREEVIIPTVPEEEIIPTPPPPPPPQADFISASAKAIDLPANYCSNSLKNYKRCDLTKGEWVPDPSPPLYTNDTCKHMFENQNCMKNGRPDTDYLHWRWQPQDCDLPRFDPKLFLQLMANKSMLFIGDSIARNQKDALLCALAQVEEPNQVWHFQGMETAYTFPSYNFTVAIAWSPFLVNFTVSEDYVWHIHLDKPHELWADPLSKFNVAVFSYYNWIYRRSIYYKNNKNFSSYDPSGSTGEHIPAMKIIWNTVMQHIVHSYHGVAILRTVSTAHFEGSWNTGGTCNKTMPYFDSKMEMTLPYMQDEVRKMQIDAFKKALKRRKKLEHGPTLKLLDITYSSLLRPDGHPGAYRIQTSYEPRNDCIHWCVPGPIDSWNQMILSDPEIMCS